MKSQAVFEIMVSLLLSMLIVSTAMYLLAGSLGISGSLLKNVTTGAEGRKVLELEKLCGCYSSG